MERRGIFWFGISAVVILLAFVVPYTILRGVDAVYGSFLFWVLFGVVAIGLNVAISYRWRD